MQYLAFSCRPQGSEHLRPGLSGLRGALTYPSAQPFEEWEVCMRHRGSEWRGTLSYCANEGSNWLYCIMNRKKNWLEKIPRKLKGSWRWKSKKIHHVHHFHFASSHKFLWSFTLDVKWRSSIPLTTDQWHGKERRTGLSSLVQFVNCWACFIDVAENTHVQILHWYTVLSTNVLIATLQVNKECPDENRNQSTVLQGSPVQDTDGHA